MKITLSNKIVIKNPPKKLKNYLIASLKIKNPKYYSAIAHGYSAWGVDPFIYNFEILPDDSLCIPRGCRPLLIDVIGKDVKIKDERTIFDYIDVDSSHIKYRPYQFENMIKFVKAGEEGLFVSPAGSGKTVIGISMIPLLGQPTLWLTHTRALANQALARIKQFLPGLKENDIGFIGDGKWKPGKIVTVALIPTLVRRMKELHEMRDNYGLVIIDESHHTPSSTFTKVVSNLNPYYLYGLTATPYRRDKLEKLMFQIVGPELIRVSVKEVENDGGILMPTVKYRAVRSKPVYGNKIQQILKQNIVNNTKRSNLIVGDVIREAVLGNYCIVLTDRKIHADILYDLISLGWEKTGVATGNYTKKYVTEQAEKLNNKEITVLVCTFSLLGEGFDVKFLNRAFVTMPFRAEGKVEQLVGRIQRTAKGKTDAIVYDYVDVDIGLLQNQFYTKGKNDCRWNAYNRLGLNIEPYEE
jgi:superfamily II DNA or RNA helicase